MATLLHTADIHLSAAEREYSLGVLAGIVDLARAEKAAFLILAGDVFDSFRDAESLRAAFREITAPLRGECEILYLPGNHELLERGRGSLRSLDLGEITLLDGMPFQHLPREGIEFLAVPHQPEYREYRSWDLPGRSADPRVAVAHGVVNGLSYAGPQEEGGGSALDPDLFRRCGADYAALGHVHDRREEKGPDLHLAYPGSARVWRRREYGARGVNLLRPEAAGGAGAGAGGLRRVAGRNGFQVEFRPLSAAGEYRELALPLSFEGAIETRRLEEGRWGAQDWVCLELSGIVEDENGVSRLEEELRRRYAGRVRRLEIRREKVAVLPGIGSQPLAEKFLRLWKELEPRDGTAERREVWLRARELGLEEIRRLMEARE